MHETEINNYLAAIKVVEGGGGGTNAVNRTICCQQHRCSGTRDL